MFLSQGFICFSKIKLKVSILKGEQNNNHQSSYKRTLYLQILTWVMFSCHVSVRREKVQFNKMAQEVVMGTRALRSPISSLILSAIANWQTLEL